MKTNPIERLITDMDSLAFFFSSDPDEGKLSSLANALKQLDQLSEKGLSQTQAFSMYWWSVLDMLSRFYSGQLDNQRATKRLKDFLKNYLPHKHGETNTLIQFRNACMHSVTLFSSDLKGGGEMRFKLIDKGDFITKTGNTVALNTSELMPRLQKAIDKYKNDVETNESQRARFEKVFRKMGYVRV